MITEAQALGVVSLAMMKAELRIEQSETAHDALITSQILAAVSYLAAAAGVADAKLGGLKMATVALVLDLYDGQRELPANPTFAAFADVFRKMAG